MAGGRGVLRLFILVVIVAVAIESTAAKYSKRKKAGHLNKKQLLKSYTNGIDHGPAGYKPTEEKDTRSKHLLGHKGEYWAAVGKESKHKRRKLGPIRDFDDVRLQDLAYESPNNNRGLLTTVEGKSVKERKPAKKTHKKHRKSKKVYKKNKRNKKKVKKTKNPKKYYKTLKKQHYKAMRHRASKQP